MTTLKKVLLEEFALKVRSKQDLYQTINFSTVINSKKINV